MTFPLDAFHLGLAMAAYYLASLVVLGIFSLLAYLTIKKLSSRRVIYAIPMKSAQFKRELKHGLISIGVDAGLTVLLIQIGLLRFEANVPWFWTLLIVTVQFIFFEVWYYFCHRLQHTKSFWWIHATHHQSRVCNPLTNFSGSVYDRIFSATGFVAPLILFSQLGLLSLTAFYIGLALNTTLGLMLHSNIEILAFTSRYRWLAWIGNPVSSHALHHSRIHGNFGLFSSFMDRRFGTYIDDTEALAQSAASGRPMRSLKQKP